MAEFFPRRQTELAAYAKAMAKVLVARPQDYRIDPASAATLQQLAGVFAERLQRASQGEGRGPMATIAKDEARADLLRAMRRLVRSIRANLQSDPDRNGKLEAIGLRPYRPHRLRRTLPPPGHAPSLQVLSASGRDYLVRVIDPLRTGVRPRRPRGAKGVAVYLHAGRPSETEPPTGRSNWTRRVVGLGPTLAVHVPREVTLGSPIWITAEWLGLNGTSPAAPQWRHVLGESLSPFALSERLGQTSEITRLAG